MAQTARAGPTLRVLLAAGVLVAIVGCSPGGIATPQKPRDQHTAPDRLMDTIDRRLAIMHDVARWKWKAMRPIEDPEREAALLAKIEAQATEAGLDPREARTFFVAQITAGKLVQAADFAQWTDSGETFTEVRDLQNDLRPQIDKLNAELLQALAAIQPQLRDARFRQKFYAWASAALAEQGFADDVRRAALEPFADD